MNSDSVNVDGTDYRFSVISFPKWTSDGWQGLVVGVRSHLEGHRELLIQFPMEFSHRHSTPHRQRPKVELRELGHAIEAALDAGWDPESRGKPFRFQIERSRFAT